VPARIADPFEYFARAPVDCYRRLGVSGADFAPVDDLKVGSLGAATIGQRFVFVGSILLDFNAEVAARMLRLADEKMRDKVTKAIATYIASLRAELGQLPQLGGADARPRLGR
jgi:lipoate-protein ligase A